MSVGYYSQDEWEDWDELPYTLTGTVPVSARRTSRRRIDGISAAAILLLIFLGVRLIGDRLTDSAKDVLPDGQVKSDPTDSREKPELLQNDRMSSDIEIAPISPAIDATSIVYPYVDFALTQGVHGASYGHMAIDIAAGKGEPVLSPITGEITGLYIDEWGNTNLVIENEIYQVLLLHGNYSVAIGQNVRQGEQVGTEGNNGYTLDMYGNSCRGRDCGYHTHINIFDKRIGTNVNPLSVLGLLHQ